MNLKKLFFLTASLTENKLDLIEYFKSNKYTIYSFNELGEISHLDGEKDQITDKELLAKIQSNLYYSGYSKIITSDKEGLDVFYFNEKIIKTEINLKKIWEEEVKLYNNKLIRVIVEFLASNHILQTINFEFDEIDIEIGENIHKLIQENKSILSNQILITHNRYFGAILSKSTRSGFRENEKDLISLTNFFQEIIPQLPNNYFSDTFNKFKQNQNSFDFRLVAFIDILGFKHIVETNQPEKIRSLISELKSSGSIDLFGINYKDKVDFQITYFSDCIVLSCKNDCDRIKEKVIESFLLTIRSIQFKFMVTFQCLIRGAVSQGNLIHTKDYCFGPAFNRAYLLESNYIHHPRILIDLNILEKNNPKTFALCEIYQGEVFSYLDLVSSCFGYLKSNFEGDIGFWHEDTEWIFFRLTELINKGLILPNEKVRLKYLYLANRFNKFLKEFFDKHPNEEFKMLSKYPQINQTLDYINI